MAGAETVGDVKLVVGELTVGSIRQLRSAVDQIRQKSGDRVATMVGWADGEKVTLIAAVSDVVIAATDLTAGAWVGEVAPIVGGGGGGKPHMAQAGGKDPARLGEALAAARKWARARLGG